MTAEDMAVLAVAATSDLDAMEVNFLSERCVCTLGANNFVLFRYG